MLFKVILVLFAVSCCAVLGDELPKGLETCHRSDPNFNKCLAKAIQGSMFILKDGDAALGIPGVDPYLIDYLKADHTGGTSNFNLRSSLNEAQIGGLGSAEIMRVATKFDRKFGLKAEGVAKGITLTGNYTMDGQILLLPIKGIGKLNISMTDVKSFIDIRGEYFDKNGDTFINITSLKIKMTPKHATFYFENVFNGDPVLSQTINSFMNENWEVVEQTLLPAYEQKLGLKFRDVSNKIFQKIPMKMIFPE